MYMIGESSDPQISLSQVAPGLGACEVHANKRIEIQEKLHMPPPHPISGQKAIFRGECMFWRPPWQEFYTLPLFYAPPTPRRAVECIGFGP